MLSIAIRSSALSSSTETSRVLVSLAAAAGAAAAAVAAAGAVMPFGCRLKDSGKASVGVSRLLRSSAGDVDAAAAAAAGKSAAALLAACFPPILSTSSNVSEGSDVWSECEGELDRGSDAKEEVVATSKNPEEEVIRAESSPTETPFRVEMASFDDASPLCKRVAPFETAPLCAKSVAPSSAEAAPFSREKEEWGE